MILWDFKEGKSLPGLENEVSYGLIQSVSSF